MRPGQDFCSLPTVEKFHFRHDKDISERIWLAFDKGNDLFPPDAAAELGYKANHLLEFTRSQIDLAWIRLEHWIGKEICTDSKKLHERVSGIIEVTSPVLNWEEMEIERDENKIREQLKNVLSRVNYRLCSYGK